jgi:hypothetical protein
MNYEEALLELIDHINTDYDTVDDIDTKILQDLKEEIESVLYERASTINLLADMWDDSYDETED